MINKNTYSVLNGNNLIYQILKNDGYFTDQIPPCFSTDNFSALFKDNNFYKKLSSLFAEDDLKDYPLEITVYKEDYIRRTLSFPNILAYIKLLDTLGKQYHHYSDLIQSPNSESKANIITNLDYPSNYRKSIMNRSIKFAGNKYKLTIDISNCYPSIYTHSIAWAMCGKEEAKKMFIGQIDRNTLYKAAEKIDKKNTKLKGSETNGLLTGPHSSRIISEIILGAIDKILSEKFEFTRYVDDYNFYFTNKYDCEKSIGEISKILSEYNFKINESKIKIEKYPFDILQDYSNSFKPSFNNRFPTYDILQKAALMENQNKKGAFKYAFKLLRNTNNIGRHRADEVNYLFYTLLSIIVNKPMLSRYAVELISKLNVEFTENEMVNKLNDLLNKELSSNHDQEVLWLLYTILRYGSKISLENIILIINSRNDLAIIIILDLLNRHRNQIYKYDTEKHKINRAIKKHLTQLQDDLSTESILTKRWLLVNEVQYKKTYLYGLFKNINNPNPSITKLFKQNNITFYKSIFKKQKKS